MHRPVRPIRDILDATPHALLGWSEIPAPMVVGLMARSGFDVILLDQQHGQHDTASCIAAIAEAALAGVPAIVRLRVGDNAEAARMLDLGAAGVVSPMIESAAEARAFAAHVRYPPVGARSFGPTRVMQLAARTDPEAHLAAAGHETLALVMIETRAALEALDDILAVPGIDGVLVGPSDLSLSLTGGRLEPESPETTAALARIAERARHHGRLACAYGSSPERARTLFGLGFHLASLGYDCDAIRQAMTRLTEAARRPPA